MTLAPAEILDFWFAGDASQQRGIWFEKNVEFDAACGRFTAAIRDARAHRLDHWATTPRGALALIILLDQLSRNVFRGSAEAFAADPQAREIARGMIATGFDKTLTPVERMFAYLPFEHAETLEDQDESVHLFETIRHADGADSVDYACRHREVIRRFGRFPHRNAVLGRINTPEEDEYLAQASAGFEGGSMSIIGDGSWRYDFRRDWARLPRWWNFGETTPGGWPQTCVQGAVAANGDVYVLCRAAHPVLVFDADGRFVSSWGEGRFSAFVHGLSIDRHGKIWIADAGLHTVTRHEPDGRLLQTLGTPGIAAATFYGHPFNMPTGTAFTRDGDVFVSDGYGNRRVHRFAPDGTLKHSWGEHGTGPGQFVLVHFIGVDWQDRIYVCDRDNHRIQLFTPDGETLAMWTGFNMPSDLVFGQEVIYVAGGDGLSIWTPERQLIKRFAPDVAGTGSLNIHGIWIDAEENIYLAQFDRTVSKLTKATG